MIQGHKQLSSNQTKYNILFYTNGWILWLID